MSLEPLNLPAADQRKSLHKKILQGLEESFPIQGSRFSLHINDLKLHPQDYSPSDEKAAILEGKSLYEPIKGVLTIKDKDGKVIDKSRPMTILNLPYLTSRITYIIDANEYSVANQLRLKPGIYARKRGNGELEAQYNLSKGANFRVSMDPESGLFHIEHQSTKIPLYPILRSLGVSHSEISKAWNPKLADQNQAKYGEKTDSAVTKLYEKVIPEFKHNKELDTSGKLEAIKEYYSNTKMDADVVKQNIGLNHDHVTPETMLVSSGKLLNIFNGKADEDDRNSLVYKIYHSGPDFLKENLGFAAKELKRKISFKLDHAGHEPTVSKVVPASMFSGALKTFITTSDVSSIPTQINPVEILDTAQKITSLGEGGIGSAHGIPDEARQIHATSIGVIDPIRTPESGNVGVDVRSTIGAFKDENGNLHALVLDARKNNIGVAVSTKDLFNHVVAFPIKDPTKKMVDVIHKGVVQSRPISEVDYILPRTQYMYGSSTNLIPFPESSQGNRLIMGSKMVGQALPLKEREAPLIQVASWQKGKSMEKELGSLMNPVAPVDGKVVKIDKDFIYIKPSHMKKAEEEKEAKDDLIKVPYYTNFPFSSKTYINHELNVKEGDSVKEDQILGDSNFTKDGTLAVGKNLKVGYMAYHGLNSNDAIVCSESAAKKMAALNSYKHIFEPEDNVVQGKNAHMSHFGTKFTKEQYSHLDEDGVIKKGSIINPDDPLIVSLRKSEPNAQSQMLGKLSKTLNKPYRDNTMTFDAEHPGRVVDVIKTPKRTTVVVQTEEPIVLGDKVSGRFGNKGIIGAIIPDDRMPQDESGKPLDLLLTSAGVISRINPGQILETALGKVAEKTGKPIAVESFSGKNNVQWVKDELKKHGLKDKETVYDPVTGRHIPGIMVGPQYMLRLFKTTKTNYSARGIGGYDVNEQPTKGGDESASGTSRMEIAALVAHNARNILQENAVLKSQKNDEYWMRHRLGLPLPALKPSFAYNKFTAMLQGAGINVQKTGDNLTLSPMTDKDVLKMSKGPIKSGTFIRAKDLKPEEGGFFDPATTGGLSGTHWAHIPLHEPVVNPIFHDSARRLLGMTGTAFDKVVSEKGVKYIASQLKDIDLSSRERELRKLTKTATGTKLDDAVKQLKYIKALKENSLTPDKAYVISNIAVVPPIIRPIVPGPNGRLIMSDSNSLYGDVFTANESLKSAVDSGLPAKDIQASREHLANAVGALYGLQEPVSPKNAARGVKGFLSYISGQGSPKHGFFQGKVLRKQLDLTGRGTIAPDINLGMDEVGIPEDMIWNMYEPFITRRLVQRGYAATDANKMITDRHPVARASMLQETKERPVIYNRAPTLHRYNMVAAYPVPVPGKTIRMPATWPEAGLAADFDGDAVLISTPARPQAVEDAKKMLLSTMIMADRDKTLIVKPQHEAVVGTYKATIAKPTGKTISHFKSWDAAHEAYKNGKVQLGDPVEID